MSHDLPVQRFRNTVSDRKFGFTMAAAALIFAGAAIYLKQNQYALPALILGLLFAAISLIHPILLKPLNTLWFYLGLALQFLVSPLILTLFFILFFVPVGVYRTLRKKRSMPLAPDPALHTYWIDRSEKKVENPFKHMF